jgi:hypothetical protein
LQNFIAIHTLSDNINASCRAFEVNPTLTRFLFRHGKGSGRLASMNRNAQSSACLCKLNVICGRSRAKTVWILNPFAATVNNSAALATKGVRLNQIIQVAALNTPGILVFELLVHESIQEPVKLHGHEFLAQIVFAYRLSSFGSVFAACCASTQPMRVSTYFSLEIPEVLF